MCLQLATLSVLLFVLAGHAAVAEQNAKNVLVIFSSVQSDPQFLNMVASEVRSRIPEPVTFHEAYVVNHLDEKRQEFYLESQAETFRRTYAGVKFDLVIAVSRQALQLAIRYRDKIFPGVPIVFTQVAAEVPEARAGPGITGLTIPVGIRETIDLALRLHPNTNEVAVISGPDPFWLRVTHSELLRHKDKVREIDFVEPPGRELLEKVSALPPNTVVLFQLSPDPSRPEFGGWELLDAVADRWPTYSAWPSICLDHGCIGGVYSDNREQALSTAKMAAQVLLGKRPEDIPIVHDSGLRVTVDWRQLRRWHIPESELPIDGVVLYREPTSWERNRKYIIPGIWLIAAQSILILGLFWQRARKRRAEAVLRESEERFRVMADTAPSLIWMCDARGKIIYLNDRWLTFTHPDPGAGYGDTWIAFIHPDDVAGILDAFATALKNRKPFSREYRLRRRDGIYRWMLDVASPRVNGDGSFGGFIGSAIDTTDQKLARKALEKVSGQLIEAQEKERSRIARELHDDICQKLAILSMKLEQANRSSSGSPASTKDNLEDIRKHCAEIAGDVQSLSHQLHSSKLDYLGIVAAVRGFCNEFSRQHEVNVKFTESNVPQSLSKDISLCLFRVAQEALHNAAKYSGVCQFAVELSGTAETIQLVVSDLGAGFDVEEAKQKQSLGLVSMQERVNLVRGTLRVESHPGEGTRIIATVPCLLRTERLKKAGQLIRAQ